MEKNLEEKHINHTISEESECRKIITIEVAPERFRDEQERVLRNMLKKVTLPGFRKGKVPADVARRRFADEIRAEALKTILPLAYGRAVSAGKLRPIGEPIFKDISAEDNRPLTFCIEVETVPQITLTEYRGVEVEQEEITVTDMEIDEVLTNLQEREAEYITVDRPAVTGDLVIIDYAPVRLDDSVNEKKRVTDYPVQLGSGHLFPAFEKAIAGTAAGATARVEIDYPDDYEPERLAGKKVTYEFTIKEIKEKRLHQLDDEFAAKVDEKFKTLAELREELAARLRGEKESEARRKREEAAIDLLIEKDPFEIPRSMVERFKNELREEQERRRRAMGLGPEEDEEKRNEIERMLDNVARRSIRRYFLIEHIAESEGIEIGEGDVQAEIERIAAESEKPIEEVRKVFAPKSEHRSKLADNLRERRVFEIIMGATNDT